MDFISDWALALIFILALADRPAAILTVSLLIATRMTGPIESTITVLLGMTTLTIGLWLLNNRLKKNVEDLLISPCDYTIGQWLKKHGIVKTVLLTDFAFAWKFEGVLGLATASNGRWSVCGWYLCLSALLTVCWILLLTPVITWYLNTFLSITQARMTLSGLILLSILTAGVLRIVLCRFYHRYRENQHENSCR